RFIGTPRTAGWWRVDDSFPRNRKMGRTSSCVSRGGRWYGSHALRSAAFGGRVVHFPATPTCSSASEVIGPHNENTAVRVTAFPHLWTVLWTQFGGEAFTLVVSEERLWNSCVGVLRTRVPEAAWQNCFG